MNTKLPKQKDVKLNHEVVKLDASFSMVADSDPEGEYKPQFVKSVIESSKEKATEEFSDPASFLKSLQ